MIKKKLIILWVFWGSVDFLWFTMRYSPGDQVIAFGAFQKYTAWISRNVRHHHQEDRKGNPIQTMALNCMVKQVKSFIWLKEAGFEDRSLQSLTRSQTNLSTTKISVPLTGRPEGRKELPVLKLEFEFWVFT